MAGFIRYEVKNGVEYGSYYIAKRYGKEKTNEVQYLGRVIDKEKGVFRSRERGDFTFTIEDGIRRIRLPIQEKLILDFGDSFLLEEAIRRSGFKKILENVFSELSDTMLSMLFYRVLCGGASCYAKTFWEGSYTRILYPNAVLESQRISEFHRLIGEEEYHREFFNAYINHILPEIGTGVLIDSTGLPNDIRLQVTAVNNHNGVISNESRLILAVDRKSELPLFFRYGAGNIVDVATLKNTLLELGLNGINVEHAIVDAGYYSEANVTALFEANISFLLRLVPNRKIYKQIIAANVDTLEKSMNLIKYRDRLVYIKVIEQNFFGYKGYAYLCKDVDRGNDEIKKYMFGALDNNDIPHDEMDEEIKRKGLFVLISSDLLDIRELLPLYYTRQAVEQIFDFSKNNADLLPLRVHSEEAFRGHLLISFIASYLYMMVNKALNGTKFCADGAFRTMRNLKCKIYESDLLVLEPTKKMNDILSHLNYQLP